MILFLGSITLGTKLINLAFKKRSALKQTGRFLLLKSVHKITVNNITVGARIARPLCPTKRIEPSYQ